MIVIGITTAIVAAGAVYLGNTNSSIKIDHVASQILTLFQTAQQRSISQEDGLRWGVYVDNVNTSAPGYSLFSVKESELNDPFFSGMPGEGLERSTLPTGVKFVVPVPGQATTTVFMKGTGLPVATTTIVLQNMAGEGLQRSVYIESNGRIDIR